MGNTEPFILENRKTWFYNRASVRNKKAGLNFELGVDKESALYLFHEKVINLKYKSKCYSLLLCLKL